MKAVEALSRIQGARAVAPLISALRDTVPLTRMAAAVALGNIGDLRATRPLAALLRDQSWSVRSASSRALRKIGGAGVLEEIIESLESPHGDQCTTDPADWREFLSIIEDLKTITGKDLGPSVNDWKQWWRRNRGQFGKKSPRR